MLLQENKSRKDHCNKIIGNIILFVFIVLQIYTFIIYCFLNIEYQRFLNPILLFLIIFSLYNLCFGLYYYMSNDINDINGTLSCLMSHISDKQKTILIFSLTIICFSMMQILSQNLYIIERIPNLIAINDQYIYKLNLLKLISQPLLLLIIPFFKNKKEESSNHYVGSFMYIIMMFILNLLTEISYHINYYTHPSFSKLFFGLIVFNMSNVCIYLIIQLIYFRMKYIKKDDTLFKYNYILNFMSIVAELFSYFLIVLITVLQSIRINGNLNYKS